MKNKLVSIIINCFNGEKFLSKTLQSVLDQTYKNFEVIFVDNCSTDKSREIFKKIKDKRFKYFKTKKKIKLYEARNFALKKVKGKFVSFLDSDDWWEKEFLSSKILFFSSSSEYGFSFSNCYHYYENKKKFEVFYEGKLPSGLILDNLLKYYFVQNSSIIIKSNLIKNFKFNPHYNIIGDYDLIIRISKKFKGMGFQNKYVNVRIHKDNFSHNNRKMFYYEYKDWIKNQNFNNKIFKKNKFELLQKLEYLKLIHLLIYKKNLKLLKDIMRFPSVYFKLKLLVMYFLPKLILKLKYKYL
ncbi:MAG: glycosyltransferase [Candidatus Pelagibacter sp. TMED165]|nr:MAG: glycosyltransferase [Candidatus Pelagibacter sp. TMED165]